jgi:tetratricopeptide (TPR) repeat protein
LNKQEFISLIEQPEQLGKSNITSLKQVVADFPYFQAAQVLLTKALYNDHHYEFEKQLKQTSLLVPDRAVLFRYIHNLSDQQQPTEIVVPEIISSLTEQFIENTPLPSIEVTTPQEITVQVEDVIVEDTAEEKHQIEVSPVVVEVIEDTTVVEDSVPETISNTEETVAEENIQEVKSSEIHSFTEWLQLQQGKKITIIEAPVEPKPQLEEPIVNAPIVQETESSEKTAMETEIAEQVKRSNVNDFESILDKFIRENPRISRGKAEFYNPVNMAKQSVEENDELVTETLANVYYKQGHYKKAIRAYEKLCLIYPHKMTYFASLIQKIKTETKE